MSTSVEKSTERQRQFSGVVRTTDAIVGMIDFIRTQSILIPCLKVVVTNKESPGPAPAPVMTISRPVVTLSRYADHYLSRRMRLGGRGAVTSSLILSYVLAEYFV